MILVLLGTQDNSFHRLLQEIDKLIENNVIKDEVIVQLGHTKYKSNNMKMFDLIPKEKLDKFQKDADLIISHGGVGSIISSIKNGKKVIAVPRLHKYNEHINDHQKNIITLFNEKGYIKGINSVEELKGAILSIKEFVPNKYKNNNDKILNIISEFIDKV